MRRRTWYPLFHLTVKIRIIDIAPFRSSAFPFDELGKATRMPEPNVLRQQRNSLVCFDLTARRKIYVIGEVSTGQKTVNIASWQSIFAPSPPPTTTSTLPPARLP